MAGRTPPEAVAAFVEPLQQAISCVSPAVLLVAGGYRPAAHPHALVLADGEPQPLRSEDDLALRVAQQYRLVEDSERRGPWKVQTAAYSYAVNRGDQELLAYQWNPLGSGRVTRPHLHVGRGAGELMDDFHRLHLPTGRIALEDGPAPARRGAGRPAAPAGLVRCARRRPIRLRALADLVVFVRRALTARSELWRNMRCSAAVP